MIFCKMFERDIMTKSNEKCTLLFMKYPKKGQVKTRISRKIGDLITVELYKNFVLDLLSTLDKIETDLWVCFYPKASQKKLAKWLGNKYFYIPQKGENLGQRMKNSFLEAFARGYRRVVVIGSDIPDLPGVFIKEAFSYFETSDVVIGPATDGGYYLVGFRYDTFLLKVFEGIHWSTDTVFRETMTILEKSNRKVHILPEWSDVDTIDDLRNLIQRNQDTEFKFSKTICLTEEILKILSGN